MKTSSFYGFFLAALTLVCPAAPGWCGQARGGKLRLTYSLSSPHGTFRGAVKPRQQEHDEAPGLFILGVSDAQPVKRAPALLADNAAQARPQLLPDAEKLELRDALSNKAKPKPRRRGRKKTKSPGR